MMPACAAPPYAGVLVWRAMITTKRTAKIINNKNNETKAYLYTPLGVWAEERQERLRGRLLLWRERERERGSGRRSPRGPDTQQPASAGRKRQS